MGTCSSVIADWRRLFLDCLLRRDDRIAMRDGKANKKCKAVQKILENQNVLFGFWFLGRFEYQRTTEGCCYGSNCNGLIVEKPGGERGCGGGRGSGARMRQRGSRAKTKREREVMWLER